MNLQNSVLSNDRFFIFGLKNLLSQEFLSDFFTVLDLDNMSKDEIGKMKINNKEIVAFASNDLSSLNADNFGEVAVLDKRCSLKDIVGYFMLKNKNGIYNSTMNLTKREKEILRLLKKGLSHDAVSQELNIKHKTVYTYRRNIMQKLGCENRIDFQNLLLQTQ